MPTEKKTFNLKEMELALEKERTEYLRNNPDGCKHCLGVWYLNKTENSITDDFSTVTYRYCGYCEAGKQFRTEDAPRVASEEEKKGSIIKAQRRAEMQSRMDVISQALSTSFGAKYYSNGKSDVKFEMKENPKDDLKEKESKKFLFWALEFVYADIARFLLFKGLNMYIYGDSGVGKTHLTTSLFHKIREEQPDVSTMYIVFDEYLGYLKDAFKKPWEKADSKFWRILKWGLDADVKRYLYECDVLFIDEVFASMDKISKYYGNALKDILDNRISRAKVTIFISNKSLGQAQDLLSNSLDLTDMEQKILLNRIRENNSVCDPKLKNDPRKYWIHVTGKALNVSTELDSEFLAFLGGEYDNEPTEESSGKTTTKIDVHAGLFQKKRGG